jgi:hypothetical protein
MKQPISNHLSRLEGRALYHGKAPKKSGKYRVGKVEDRTIAGRVFDSVAETKYYAELKTRESLGEVSDIECQVEFRVQINGQHFTSYKVDFAFTDTATGQIQYVEIKSVATRKERDWPLRRRAVQLFHGITIQEVIR